MEVTQGIELQMSTIVMLGKTWSRNICFWIPHDLILNVNEAFQFSTAQSDCVNVKIRRLKIVDVVSSIKCKQIKKTFVQPCHLYQYCFLPILMWEPLLCLKLCLEQTCLAVTLGIKFFKGRSEALYHVLWIFEMQFRFIYFTSRGMCMITKVGKFSWSEDLFDTF